MKLIFRGARIRYFDGREDESGFFTRVHMTTDYSAPVRDAMEWGEPPEGFSSAKLDGSLTASHIILAPNGKELAKHELQMPVSGVSDFQFFRVKNEDGESTSTELRFIIRTPVEGACGLLEAYKRVIGKGEAQLRVNYEKQDDLPLESKAEEDDEDEDGEADTGCIACNNGIPMAQGSDTVHASGSKCTKSEAATIAPAAVMGGTHAGRGKRRAGQGNIVNIVPEQVN